MKKWKRIVVKVGSSTLTKENGKINLRRIDKLVQTLSDLKNDDLEIILVTSGAIAAGLAKLNLTKRPDDIPTKQAAAAVGQCELMYIYDKFFSEYGHCTAQILVTKSTFDDPIAKTNAINTLNALLKLKTIPIVNENDTIAYDEIVVGDNDTLSALVAILCQAQGLILLSDIDGLYDDNPATNPQARLIPLVEDINEETMRMAKGSSSHVGTGGMITKLHAAQIATHHGVEMIIANGKNPEILYDILVDNKQVGPLFRTWREKS